MNDENTTDTMQDFEVNSENETESSDGNSLPEIVGFLVVVLLSWVVLTQTG